MGTRKHDSATAHHYAFRRSSAAISSDAETCHTHAASADRWLLRKEWQPANPSRKGQIWSLDFTSAMVLLSFMLLFSLILWNSLAVRWKTSADYRQLQTDALFASDALMTTSGQPYSWEMRPSIDNNISVIGLANGRNELSAAKIERLVAANSSAYGLVKEKLGLSRYELFINITSIEGNSVGYMFGRSAGGMNSSVAYERLGLLNGTPVRVKIEVWR